MELTQQREFGLQKCFLKPRPHKDNKIGFDLKKN